MPYIPVPSAPPYVPPYNPDFIRPSLPSRLGSLAIDIIFGLGQFIKNHPLISLMLGVAGIYFWSRKNPRLHGQGLRQAQYFDQARREWVHVRDRGYSSSGSDSDTGSPRFEYKRKESPPTRAPGYGLPFSGGFPSTAGWSQPSQQQPPSPSSGWSVFGSRRVVSPPRDVGRTQRRESPPPIYVPPHVSDTTHNGGWTSVEPQPFSGPNIARLDRDPDGRTPVRRKDS